LIGHGVPTPPRRPLLARQFVARLPVSKWPTGDFYFLSRGVFDVGEVESFNGHHDCPTVVWGLTLCLMLEQVYIPQLSLDWITVNVKFKWDLRTGTGRQKRRP
jgi:hypothetical protein